MYRFVAVTTEGTFSPYKNKEIILLQTQNKFHEHVVCVVLFKGFVSINIFSLLTTNNEITKELQQQ